MTLATVGKIAAYLEQLAPLSWAESWDNVGLQVGDPAAPAERILVALELTDAVAEEAMAMAAQMLVLHHPPIFRPLKALRFDSGAGRRLQRLIQAGISIYAAHTNLDQAVGGTNDTLAQLVGLQEPVLLQKIGEERYVKLVVFVPQGHEEQVRTALARAGAGHIGNYSHCTFQAVGTGTFLPLAGSNPFIGEQGKLEYVSECRLETIIPEGQVRQAVQAMIGAHPYEEVAYDLYPLANQGRERGHGRIGRLARSISLGQLAAEIKQRLGVPHLRVVGDLERAVEHVAVAAGAGDFLIPQAARKGADVLVTGDVKHHDAEDALDAGMAVIDVGHWGSERIVVPPVASYLRQKLVADGVTAAVLEATRGADPFQFL